MIAALPLLALALLVVVARPRVDGWRIAALVAAVAWGVLAVVVIEVLSWPRAFTFAPVLTAWLAAVGALGWAVWRGPRVEWPPIARSWSALGLEIRTLLAATAVLTTAVGIVALLAPPNTDDVLTYHMPRVAQWIQNGGVGLYRTSTERQIHLAPWAEFAIAHLQILAGSDRLANLVQWLGMIGCMIGASAIAREVGGDARAQCLSALVAATIPIGVLEATSAKNDWAVALWLVCLTVFVLRRSHAVLVGAAAGLAVLTKATGALFALPLLGWFAATRVARDGRGAWRALAVVAIVAASLNAGHLLRNTVAYGWPLGPMSEGPPFRYVNDAFGLRPLASVALRNAAVHLATPVWRLNAAIHNTVVRVHRWMGADVDAPETTWGNTRFQVLPSYTDETKAPNGPHLLLFCAACVAVVVQRRWQLAGYALVPVAGFVIFSAALRWQPWHSRLELPLFVLAAPLVGVLLASRRAAALVVGGVLLLHASAAVAWNTVRPLVGPDSVFRAKREAQYFAHMPALRPVYRAAVGRARELGCRHIGLVTGGDDPEYGLWILARSMFRADVRFDHMNLNPAEPCAVIVTRDDIGLPERFVSSRATYRRDLVVPPVTVYVRDPR